MAIYHFSIKIGSRAKGQSAVAASAYRSGEKLTDKETGLISDYTRKSGVVFSEIALCENAPSEYSNRETLWNAVHSIEKNKNAQLWREFEVALPKELNRDEQIETVRDFVNKLTEQGMCIDWALHDKGDGNPHAHIMATMRSIEPNGKWSPKSRKVYDLDENGERIFQKIDKSGRKQYKNHKEDYNDWNAKERVEEWRSAWADCCNARLAERDRIDHRSYERQRSELIPTIHEGYIARKLVKDGKKSERVQINEDIRQKNSQLKQINLEFKKIEIEKAPKIIEFISKLYRSACIVYGEKDVSSQDRELATKILQLSPRVNEQNYQTLPQVQTKEYLKVMDMVSDIKRENSDYDPSWIRMFVTDNEGNTLKHAKASFYATHIKSKNGKNMILIPKAEKSQIDEILENSEISINGKVTSDLADKEKALELIAATQPKSEPTPAKKRLSDVEITNIVDLKDQYIYQYCANEYLKSTSDVSYKAKEEYDKATKTLDMYGRTIGKYKEMEEQTRKIINPIKKRAMKKELAEQGDIAYRHAGLICECFNMTTAYNGRRLTTDNITTDHLYGIYEKARCILPQKKEQMKAEKRQNEAYERLKSRLVNDESVNAAYQKFATAIDTVPDEQAERVIKAVKEPTGYFSFETYKNSYEHRIAALKNVERALSKLYEAVKRVKAVLDKPLFSKDKVMSDEFKTRSERENDNDNDNYNYHSYGGHSR